MWHALSARPWRASRGRQRKRLATKLNAVPASTPMIAGICLTVESLRVAVALRSTADLPFVRRGQAPARCPGDKAAEGAGDQSPARACFGRGTWKSAENAAPRSRPIGRQGAPSSGAAPGQSTAKRHTARTPRSSRAGSSPCKRVMDKRGRNEASKASHARCEVQYRKPTGRLQ